MVGSVEYRWIDGVDGWVDEVADNYSGPSILRPPQKHGEVSLKREGSLIGGVFYTCKEDSSF